ncbi:uncharacterized protein BJ171DRAFT_239681 [Polychytrium aggregatum]|uniref:uncharacterized protein n=1 Tax=Polychytrium aggregatum TaxID=110093 RepID=UPI0022FDDBCA|nr:uncharacterized protein BJ171DRAFT_239681 [Polychytrium aggregatum]KAI9208409.1 hypothetical protein BJ171DRAFT_239681 [Polychytrium aggregatum]
MVCNDAFLATLDLATLTKLPQLARQYRGVLSLVSNRAWMHQLYRKLKITAAIFTGVDVSIDRRQVLEGMCSFCSRKDGCPRSFEAYQKEMPLWWAICRCPSLEANTRRLLSAGLIQANVDCHACTSNSSQDMVRTLDPQEQFHIVDSARIIQRGHCRSCSGMPHGRFGYSVIRFDHHPFHTAEQWSQLLPHELDTIQNRPLRTLRLVNCSFSSVSGWPVAFPFLSDLQLNGKLPEGEIDSLEGMPQMPQLEKLMLPLFLKSLECIPQSLCRLQSLDLGHHAQIASLVGLPLLPSLKILVLPPSILSLQGLPAQLDRLVEMNMWGCSRLESLRWLPVMPELKLLKLPQSGPSLNDFDTHCSGALVSASVTELWIPSSFSGLQMLSAAFATIRTLHVSISGPGDTFVQFLPMPHLEQLLIHGHSPCQFVGLPESVKIFNL